jgi:hypothetical protein
MRNVNLLSTMLFAACGVALAGCSGSKQGGAPATGAAGSAPDSANAVFANQLAENAAEQSRAQRLKIVRLEMYQLVIPLGAISRSEEFWKHVDEQTVDVGTYDLLRKNGWRVGVAPTAEWGYFKDILDMYPASSTPRVLSVHPGGGTGSMELLMQKGVAYQNVFYFNDANSLHGRTFERCDNVVNVTVAQVARKPGEARVTVCPTVRSLRKRFEVSMKNDERVIEYVQPEHLYDLNLQTDIPVGHFLVIAPSPEVKWKTSLGATFLVQDGDAERQETVLIMVPRAAELEETITRPPAAPPAR